MKSTIKILALGVFSIFLFSCSSIVHDRLITGSVVRDCTGTYVRIGEKEDYLVCNSDILKDKKAGEKVSVIYDNTKNCPESEGKAVCAMYHESKGIIRIKSIK